MADDDVGTLELALDDLRSENKRLRDARGSVSRQLGPLPISAALIGGLVTAFPGRSAGSGWHIPLIAAAAAAFLVMLVISMRYSALAPYRQLRDELEARVATGNPLPATPRTITAGVLERVDRTDTKARWYAAMTEVERDVRGQASSSPPLLIRLLRPPTASNLQEAFDLEWKGLFLTQLWFAVVVILLIAARII